MELQDQVISLQQAKKLKELWFKKKSYLIRFFDRDGDECIWTKIDSQFYSGSTKKYPAYTISELMDILPRHIKITSEDYIEWMDKEFRWYNVTLDEKSLYIQKNLTHALWDMLIYLLENNLLPNQDK